MMQTNIAFDLATQSVDGIDSKANSVLIAYSATIDNITKIVRKLLTAELQRLLGENAVKAYLEEGIANYIYAAGFLSLAGRDITKESLASMVESLGVKPNEILLDAVFKAGIKSHLMYVYAYYYLLSTGKEIGVEDLEAVLTKLGISVDKAAASEAIVFMNKELGISRQ